MPPKRKDVITHFPPVFPHRTISRRLLILARSGISQVPVYSINFPTRFSSLTKPRMTPISFYTLSSFSHNGSRAARSFAPLFGCQISSVLGSWRWYLQIPRCLEFSALCRPSVRTLAPTALLMYRPIDLIILVYRLLVQLLASLFVSLFIYLSMERTNFVFPFFPLFVAERTTAQLLQFI